MVQSDPATPPNRREPDEPFKVRVAGVPVPALNLKVVDEVVPAVM